MYSCYTALVKNITAKTKKPRSHLGKKKPQKQKVFVGLSGGVDSAVSAAILQKQGYEVTGVFIKVWTPDFLPCTWREDRRDAMRVCAHLNIPFITLDLEKEYKKEVVDYMISEYASGRTPNPDVMCNKAIKFGAFYAFALKHGADCIATGHYAQIRKLKNGTFELLASTDEAKDQSYFIWNITKNQLPHIVFPVGGMQKKDVRNLAKKFGLPNAEKKDSQGLCFLGKVDMKEFLSHFLKQKKGSVFDTNGKKIGTHDGVMFLTIGQRHGFTVHSKKTESKPLYIIQKNIKKNSIVVSPLKPEDILSIGKTTCTILQTNSHSEIKEGKIYDIRFRYHQTPLRGTISIKANKSAKGLNSKQKKGQEWAITLEKPFAGISGGQSAVIYDGDVLVGGGVIA